MYKLNEDQLEFIENNEENFRNDDWEAVIKNYMTGVYKPGLNGIGNFFLETFGENFLRDIGDTIPLGFFNPGYFTSINIPNSIEIIGSWAFAYCTLLNSVILPYSIRFINNWAFKGCNSLQLIYIPDSVKGIGRDIFEDCDSLESIKLYHDSYAEKWCMENELGDKIKYLD